MMRMGRLLVLMGRMRMTNKWPMEVACEATGSLQDKRAFFGGMGWARWEDMKQWQWGESKVLSGG